MALMSYMYAEKNYFFKEIYTGLPDHFGAFHVCDGAISCSNNDLKFHLINNLQEIIINKK